MFSEYILFLSLFGQINLAPIVEVRSSGNQLEAQPGLVRLETSIKAESYAWFIFEPANVDYLTTNNDKTLVFAACKPNQIYSVGLITVDFTNKSIKQYRYFVKIADNPNPNPNPPNPNPEPEPEPQPNPDQDPVFPDGKYKLAKFSYELGKMANSTTPGKTILLANNFQAVASMIAAGTLKDINSANAQLRTLNQQLFPAPIPSDWQLFFDSFSGRMSTLFQNGELKTLDDLRIAFVEIEKGLRAVK